MSDQHQEAHMDRRVHTEAKLTEMEGRLSEKMEGHFVELKRLFMDAFPGGDPHGHRIAHEKSIKEKDRWDRIKFSVLEKVTSGGVWAAIAFIGLAVWEQFKHEAKK